MPAAEQILFYNGRNYGRKWERNSEMGHIHMVRDVLLGPVHHRKIRGMPWVTIRPLRNRPPEETIELHWPGSTERLHILALQTVLASRKVTGVEVVSQIETSEEASLQCRGTAETDGETQALDGRTKTGTGRVRST